MKRIISVRKVNGKIIAVKLKDGKMESLQEVINNYNKGDRYVVDSSNEDVKPFNNDTEIRSHKNGSKTDNLDNLPQF